MTLRYSEETHFSAIMPAKTCGELAAELTSTEASDRKKRGRPASEQVGAFKVQAFIEQGTARRAVAAAHKRKCAIALHNEPA